MPREYRHMKQYEKEILELKAKGLTQREIGEQLGFRQSQVKEFFKRYNRNKVNVKSTCISKMPSQRTFSETANSYFYIYLV